MFATNTYRIRIATEEDTDTLNRLAAHRALRPLEGRVLIGERDGAPGRRPVTRRWSRDRR